MRTKKGRRPIAPPRLVCTLESPVSLRIDTGQLGIQPGPASSVPVISPFRNTFRRTLASALAPDVIGPRSHGRRAQTARSLLCSLDSPPSDGRWVGSDGTFGYSPCSRASEVYTLVSESSVSGLILPVGGMVPIATSRTPCERLKHGPSRLRFAVGNAFAPRSVTNRGPGPTPQRTPRAKGPGRSVRTMYADATRRRRGPSWRPRRCRRRSARRCRRSRRGPCGRARRRRA